MKGRKKSRRGGPPAAEGEAPPVPSEDHMTTTEGQVEEAESVEQPRAEAEGTVEQTSVPSEGLTVEAEANEQASKEVESVEEPVPEEISKAKAAAEAVRELAKAFIEMRNERDEMKGNWVQTTADYKNYRKRVDRDRHKSKEEASERLMLELVPILDALDSALKVEISTTESMRKGMEGVRHLLLEVLKREGLTLVDATLGMPFDPTVHDALIAEGSGDVVKAELRRGYRYQSGKLLRPAEVEVGSASSTNGEDTAESPAEDEAQPVAADVGDGAVVPPDASVSGVAEDGGAPEEGETPVGKD